MPRNPKAVRLGILGSGQLARMLTQSAQKLGLNPLILADQADSPAAQVCPDVILGSIRDSGTLRKFFGRVDQVIFENEFIPCDLLESAASGLPVRFTPELRAMRFLQDKLNQKQCLEQLGIPTAPYLAAPEDLQEPELWLRTAAEKFGKRFVLKWAQLGYDGKGTLVADLEQSAARATLFCEEAALKRVRIYAEEFVPFRRELAIIAVHSISGEFATWPLVISEQVNGVCARVHGPASGTGAKRLELQARKAALHLARSLGLHGTFALEFFETKKGRLLVNEIAPRVHNTGHYTQDASDTDQFENHIRAVLGLPLGSVACRPAFAMVNLLGPDGIRRRLAPPVLPPLSAHGHLHWYGKHEILPGRKMGHINASADSPAKLKKLVAEIESCKNLWLNELRKGDS